VEIMRIKNVLLGLMAISITAFSSVGAARMDGVDSFTIKEALTYSIEDELLARAEYEEIMEKYGEIRPFVNIIEAEKKHIEYLEPLLEKYGVEYPVIPDNSVILPDSLEESYRIGVEAEIANIAMYEKLLKNELPEDIRDIFIKLKNASKNHLKAFERQLMKIK
jgi:hypothetical protein